MVYYHDDYEYGYTKEQELKPILEQKFGNLHATDKTCKYDFENEICLIELKSRKFNHDKYQTTLLACNKLFKTNKKLYYVFNFLDGLYYIKYNKNKFENYDIYTPKYQYGRLDKKPHYLIPISHLKIMTTK